MTQTIQELIDATEKGCGYFPTKAKVKGIELQARCGNTGFKDSTVLCEVCRARLQALKQAQEIAEKETQDMYDVMNARHNVEMYAMIEKKLVRDAIDELAEFWQGQVWQVTPTEFLRELKEKLNLEVKQ